MLSILVFALVVSSALSADITSNEAPEFIGDYKLMFLWPRRDARDIPNCTIGRYSSVDFKGDLASVSCECGRKDARLVLLNQKTRYSKLHPLLVDVLDSYAPEVVREAFRDTCECQPKNFDRVMVVKMSDNMFLMIEKDEGITKKYLFAKEPPAVEELREIIKDIPHAAYDDGALVCDVSKIKARAY